MPDLIEPIDNPFQMVYDALWNMLEDDVRFKNLVVVGNRLKFKDREDATRQEHTSTADYPKVQLLLGQITGNLLHSSSSSRITRDYTWLIEAGEFVYNTITPIEWTIVANTTKWCSKLTGLIWKEQHFVKEVNLVQADMDKFAKELRERGLNGWLAIMTIRVNMYFATSGLSSP